MKLEEFLQQNNTTFLAEVKKCKTVEELEELVKFNDLELTKNELEAFKLRFQEDEGLLLDEELDSVAGGQSEHNYYYNTGFT